MSGHFRVTQITINFGDNAKGSLDERGAELSADQRFRYQLHRAWQPEPRRTALWVMLNPSTADARADDPTIKKCIGFSKQLGCGRLVVVNLFAFRATEPKDLIAAERLSDVVGPENDRWILEEAARADLVICAWGANAANPRLKRRAVDVLALLSRAELAGKDLHALNVTAGGQPGHPLTLPYSSKLRVWKVHPVRPAEVRHG